MSLGCSHFLLHDLNPRPLGLLRRPTSLIPAESHLAKGMTEVIPGETMFGT